MDAQEEFNALWQRHRNNLIEAKELIAKRKTLYDGRHHYPDYQGTVGRNLTAIEQRFDKLRRKDEYAITAFKETILELPDSPEKATLMADYITLVEGSPFPEMPDLD